MLEGKHFGNVTKAQRLFQRALDVEPTNPDAQLGFMHCKAMAGDALIQVQRERERERERDYCVHNGGYKHYFTCHTLSYLPYTINFPHYTYIIHLLEYTHYTYIIHSLNYTRIMQDTQDPAFERLIYNASNMSPPDEDLYPPAASEGEGRETAAE